jgi:hypothetical protein
MRYAYHTLWENTVLGSDRCGWHAGVSVRVSEGRRRGWAALAGKGVGSGVTALGILEIGSSLWYAAALRTEETRHDGEETREQ